jgi:formate hydrogenlyase subunit 4
MLLGVIAKVRAWFAGRKGPPLIQVYRNIAKLMRKQVVLNDCATWVFLAAPAASVAAGIAAALATPMGGASAPLGFAGDMVFVAGLFGIARFMAILAALDTGSPFGWMGAAREATWAILAEPALFFGLAALAYHSKELSLGPAFFKVGMTWGEASGPFILVLAGWIIVFLAENSRMPFNDPASQQELEMTHEAMTLDHSGPPLAFAIYGAGLKLMVLGTFLVRLCLPLSTKWWIDWPAYFCSLALLAAAVGTIESCMARLKLLRAPQLLVVAGIACTFGFLLMFLQPLQ